MKKVKPWKIMKKGSEKSAPEAEYEACEPAVGCL